MTAKTAALAEAPETNKPRRQSKSAEEIILEADYSEDRPIALLAERQREFQKSLRGQYTDTEMPSA